MNLFRKKQLDQDMDEELRSHIEMKVEENIAQGLSPEEARFAAMRQFGRLISIKETCREQRENMFTRNLALLVRDLSISFRQLHKNPGFTFVALATVAIGIAANSVVFSFGKAILWRDLKFQDSQDLAWIRIQDRATGFFEERISWTDFEDVRAASSVESAATFGAPGTSWEDGDGTIELPALRVTPSLAEVLRVKPVLGRLLTEADAQPGAPDVVMISHELWMRRFKGSPEILGKTLLLDEKQRTVVGILPPGLEFPLQRSPTAGTGNFIKTGVQDFWFPLYVGGEDRTSRGARMFCTIVRLKPGSRLGQVNAELAAMSARSEKEFPVSNRGLKFEVIGFKDYILGRTAPAIKVLACAVAAILLICCVNLTNLFLARGITKQRELAVRLSLGAGRGHLIRMLMTESLLVSLVGGAVGIGLAFAAVHIVRTSGPADVPFLREAVVDWPVIIFTMGLSVVTAFSFGLFPAIQLSRGSGVESLRSGSRVSPGTRIRAWQSGLLAGQVAIVVVLVISAALLLESFRRLMRLDPGYQYDQVINVGLSVGKTETNGESSRRYRNVQLRLAAVPGVAAVGAIHSTPLTGMWTFDQRVRVKGRPVPEVDQPAMASTYVAFDYFEAMNISLIAGRVFRSSEFGEDDFPQVVILNQTAAARLFPGEIALGKYVSIGPRPERYCEVIGVVEDTREVRLEEKPQPRFFLNFAFGGSQFLVRTTGPVEPMIPVLRDAILQFGNEIRLHDIKPLSQIVASTVAERRFLMSMVTIYAAVALSIAAVGIFGVVAYQVAQRKNEFGVRLALGATSSSLFRLVLIRTAKLVTFGLIVAAERNRAK